MANKKDIQKADETGEVLCTFLCPYDLKEKFEKVMQENDTNLSRECRSFMKATVHAGKIII